MRELYRCSMMPGMPAEPVSDSRLSAQDVMPVCGTCQSAGRMAAGDKELLMRQIISGTRWQKCIQRNLPVRSIRKRRSL